MTAWSKMGVVRRVVPTLAGLVVLSACTATPSAPNDPLEPFNRAVFGFNQAADNLLIRPVSVAYREVVPGIFRANLTNFLRNLRTPIILVNELLQGDLEGAEVAAARFFINTIVGIGGLFDIAVLSDERLAFRSEDFGQTLATWGVGDGPYLMLPILGPSTVRDGIGLGVDALADPFGLLSVIGGFSIALPRVGGTILDERSRSLEALDEVEASSIDFYAALRSLYGQARQIQIRDGAQDPFPEFEDDDFEDFDDTETSDGTGAAGAGASTVARVPAAAPAYQVPVDLILDLQPSQAAPVAELTLDLGPAG